MKIVQPFILFLLLSAFSCNSHESAATVKSGDTVYVDRVDTIYIARENQSQTKPYATYCGIYDGKLSMKEILANNRIEVENKKEIRIVSFQMNATIGGVDCDFKCLGDTLSKEVKSLLRRVQQGGKFYFSHIKACNISNDTIVLNPIVILVIGK